MVNFRCMNFSSHMYREGLSGEDSACTVEAVRDTGLIPGSGRFPGGGHGNPLQGSCLENFMDRGAWRAKPMGSQRGGHN